MTLTDEKCHFEQHMVVGSTPNNYNARVDACQLGRICSVFMLCIINNIETFVGDCCRCDSVTFEAITTDSQRTLASCTVVQLCMMPHTGKDTLCTGLWNLSRAHAEGCACILIITHA